MISEEFLYFLWSNRLFNPSALRLCTGEPVDILHPGFRNTGSGPDFIQSKIRIDGLIWAGSVEIHVLADDWNKHGHHKDPAYNPVILHAVHESNAEVKTQLGSSPPTLALKGAYDPTLLERFQRLTHGLDRIPCAGQLNSVPALVKADVMAKMLVERLQDKISRMNQIKGQDEKEWPELLYRLLGRAMGFRTNAEGFDWLCNQLPYAIIKRNRTDPETVEALLFGTSGLLQIADAEPYTNRLLKTWQRLQRHYRIDPIPAHAWTFGSVRPSNFPTLRIAQFASLLSSGADLFDSVRDTIQLSEMTSRLDTSASDYWHLHYRFGHPSPTRSGRMGKDALYALVINAIAPFLFYYGKMRHSPLLCDKALCWLEATPAESNRITRMWSELGWIATSAAESQAQFRLKHSQCDYRLCIRCGIGQELIRCVPHQTRFQREVISSQQA
ncbi:MAG: DUF2851 family protein [Sphingobacteriales bacterium]|nr:DUF2851 family protein [Sphingobacteriales bacterium]